MWAGVGHGKWRRAEQRSKRLERTRECWEGQERVRVLESARKGLGGIERDICLDRPGRAGVGQGKWRRAEQKLKRLEGNRKCLEGQERARVLESARKD